VPIATKIAAHSPCESSSPAFTAALHAAIGWRQASLCVASSLPAYAYQQSPDDLRQTSLFSFTSLLCNR